MDDLFEISQLNAIKEHLINARETLAVGESVTSGLLQLAFSSADFAAKYFQGGITVYNIGQKSRHLMIDPIHAIECNCVSEKIARDMAKNACKLFSGDWGIGITGYSSPVPASGNELFCYFAIAHKDKVVYQNKITAQIDSSFEVQIFYVKEVLKALQLSLASPVVTGLK